MVQTVKLTALLALMSLLLHSCFKDPELDEQAVKDAWNTNLLLPIVNTKMFIEDAANISDAQGSANIAASTISPLWTGDRIVPPASGLSTAANPSSFDITQYFEKVFTDSLDMTVTITNKLPISVSKGTILVFRNQEEGTIITKHPLDQDVEPDDEYTFNFLIFREPGEEPPLVESGVEFYLEDFRTPGSNGSLVNFDGANVQFKFQLNWIKINEILVNSGQTFNDTVSFDFDLSSGNSNINIDNAVNGTLKVRMSSGMPLNVLWDMRLLDANGDSLMTLGNKPIELAAAKTNNATGDVLEFTNFVLEIPLNQEELERLQLAKSVSAIYDVNTIDVTSDPSVRINANSFIALKLIAELNAQPANVDFN